MKPCPFCGHEIDLEDGDTLYPNGSGWEDHPDLGRHYCFYRQVPKEQWCYSMHCLPQQVDAVRKYQGTAGKRQWINGTLEYEPANSSSCRTG